MTVEATSNEQAATIQPMQHAVADIPQKLRIDCWHPAHGSTSVELTIAQVGCLMARLRQIAYALDHRFPMSAIGSCSLATGADARLATDPDGAPTVVIQRGHVEAYLTPDQLTPLGQQLARFASAIAGAPAAG